MWQAAVVISQYLEQQSAAYLTGKTVLELGAGAGLPSLLAALQGAKLAVVTDYPDNNLIENLCFNVSGCFPDASSKQRIVARGYLWGSDTQPLLKLLPKSTEGIERSGFDTLILADLLFNHACHESLLKTIIQTLAKHVNASALVFFTPYRPWLLEKDMAFFDLVREDGQLYVEELGQWMMDEVMFKEDRGDEKLRRTVFGFRLRWSRM